MRKAHSFFGSVRRTASVPCHFLSVLVVFFAMNTSVYSAESDAAPGQAGFDENGVLSDPHFTLAPSEFMSDGLKDAYVQGLQQLEKYPALPGVNATMADFQNYREKFDQLVMKPALDKKLEAYDLNIEHTSINGVEVFIVTPADKVPVANQERVLLNLHGGGFFLGWPSGALSESVFPAALGKMKVVTINYRMFPEHEFPAASEDVAKVYQELLKEYPPQNIGIFGSSAGGALTAQAMAWFHQRGLPMPGAIGVFAAGISSFAKGDSSMWGTAGLWVRPADRERSVGYMASASADDPLAFPDVAPEILQAFPPTLFFTGTRAFEMSSAIHSHAQLLKQGVDSHLYVLEGGWHGSLGLAPDAPEVLDANKYVARWFDSRLGK